MTIHQWLYDIVCDICHDREYIYASFVRHFSALLNEIFKQGRFSESGKYQIQGMKSGLIADITWTLEGRLDLVRLNAIRIKCVIKNKYSGDIESEQTKYFELSTGESTTGRIES